MTNEHLEGEKLFVVSHVARDLLQTAAVFKTEKAAIWEYVSNGLQYSQPGVSARVEVHIDGRRKQVTIADNGSGMDWAGLQNFWTMHGENLDRLAGKHGRGRFGTGKSAAFGIADLLRITTVKNGKRNRVELRRSEIQKMRTGDPIPLKVLERNVATRALSGTTIEVAEIQLRHLNVPAVVKYIERHLARWPRDSAVIVNNQICEYAEPAVAIERRVSPSTQEAQVFGDVELVLKVAKAPLDEDQRGVAVFSYGVWHETTLAGAEGREMSQYVFGEIDVPALDDSESTIPTFDATRSLALNRESPIVSSLMAFVGRSVETVRRELVTQERERRASEEARRLEQQAQEIARVLNDDFDAFRSRLARVRAQNIGGRDLGVSISDASEDGEMLVPGKDISGADDQGIPHRGEGGGDGDGGDGPLREDWVHEGEEPDRARRAGGKGRRGTPRGGFGVRFANLGMENDRSKYSPDERVILVNLDHPQVAAARAGASEHDPGFMRLVYEIAFTEYAVAVAYELDDRDEYREPADAIFDIRDAINRLARRGAALYRNNQ